MDLPFQTCSDNIVIMNFDQLISISWINEFYLILKAFCLQALAVVQKFSWFMMSKMEIDDFDCIASDVAVHNQGSTMWRRTPAPGPYQSNPSIRTCPCRRGSAHHPPMSKCQKKRTISVVFTETIFFSTSFLHNEYGKYWYMEDVNYFLVFTISFTTCPVINKLTNTKKHSYIFLLYVN
jgi:hypothetical protein